MWWKRGIYKKVLANLGITDLEINLPNLPFFTSSISVINKLGHKTSVSF